MIFFDLLLNEIAKLKLFEKRLYPFLKRIIPDKNITKPVIKPRNVSVKVVIPPIDINKL
ncbi:hypothetical protein LCGC14_2133880, partial [marine sediment metagenome]